MRYREITVEDGPAPKPKKAPSLKTELLRLIKKNSYSAAEKIEAMIRAGEPLPPGIPEALIAANGLMIRLFPDAPEAMQIAAVSHMAEAIRFIPEPSEAVQMAAVERDPGMLREIANPTPRVELAAIAKHPYAIRGVKNPSIEAQTAAMQADPGTFEAISNPAPEICGLVAEKMGAAGLRWIIQKRISLTPDWVKASITKEPYPTVEMFNDLPPEIQRFAYERSEHVYDRLKEMPSFDPEIEREHRARLHKRERDTKRGQRLPQVGERKPGTYSGMSADQMAALRFFDRTGKDAISVRELKAQPWGNTPYFMGLVKQTKGRDITRADITGQSAEPSTDARQILDLCRLTTINWEGAQRAFDRPNRAAVFHATGRQFEEVFLDGLPEEEATKAKNLLAAASTAGHPVAPKKTVQTRATFVFGGGGGFSEENPYTVGWVRFTVFGRDIWIDEIQTDLPKLLPDACQSKLKGLSEAMTLDFIRQMRRRGAERFYMPSYDMKTELYQSSPPVSIYRDLPKKMRFKMTTVHDIDPKVDGREAWLLEGYKPR